MKLSLAEKKDLDNVLLLYESVKKTKYCAWDSEYPTIENINYDFEHDCLYVLKGDEKVIGAISINYEPEFDDVKDVWLYTESVYEIARVVVDVNYQNKGLAEYMVNEICKILINKGMCAIHLAVNVNNLPAVSLYKKCGFYTLCEVNKFNSQFYLLEKKIKK